MSYAVGLRCLRCGQSYGLKMMFEGCPRCADSEVLSNLVVEYDYDGLGSVISRETITRRPASLGIWRYRELLPLQDERHTLSLSEGSTPLIHSTVLGRKLGLRNLYLKDESRNPTWSFKDRFSAAALSKALEFGVDTVVAASTGNLGASVAAYSARAGLSSVILTIPTVPFTMLGLMRSYGAKVVAITTPAGRWELMSKGVREYGWYPAGTYTTPTPTGNPYGVQGYKTIGYEVVEQLGWRAPTYIIQPTAYGEGLYGVWRGINEFHRLGLAESLPVMVAAEPEAGGPLYRSMMQPRETLVRTETKKSVAFSIAGSITSYQALRAVKDSKGFSVLASEEEILQAQNLIAASEGVLAEASSAASVAAVKKLREEGRIDSDDIVVCVLTSTGLKDLENRRQQLAEIPTIEPVWSELQRVLKHTYGG
ncbi:MAG: threonine synthase [Candidatus Caldarchaeum sp.]